LSGLAGLLQQILILHQASQNPNNSQQIRDADRRREQAARQQLQDQMRNAALEKSLRDAAQDAQRRKDIPSDIKWDPATGSQTTIWADGMILKVDNVKSPTKVEAFRPSSDGTSLEQIDLNHALERLERANGRTDVQSFPGPRTAP